MITIDFSKRKNSGLCDFLYSSIKSQILNGTLSPRERLPSRRALAEHLQVSEMTVQNAYSNLLSEGLIYSAEKRGYFVEDIPAAFPALSEGAGSAASPRFSEEKIRRLFTRTDNRKLRGANGPENATREKSYFADFKSNSTSREKFPFALWARLMRQVLNSGDGRLLARQNFSGIQELRNAIAAHLNAFRLMNVRPEQIVIGAGTDSLYLMAAQFLGADKIYGVENPGYKQFSLVLNLCRAKCLPVNLDEGGIRISELKKKRIQIAHVSPQHHFPTGIVMPYKRRLELLHWSAEKEGRIIIEDDYDSEFRFNGKPVEPLFSLDKKGRVIYINTFSKTLSPSIRISYMVLPENLVEEFNSKMGFFSCPVSVFEQKTLALFIDGGFYEKHLFKMKNYYRNLRNDLIREFSKSRISKMAEVLEKDSGLHFLLGCSASKLSGEEIQSRLKRRGVNIALLSDFYYDDTLNGNSKEAKSFVINYSGIEKERVGETVHRMEAAICRS